MIKTVTHANEKLAICLLMIEMGQTPRPFPPKNGISKYVNEYYVNIRMYTG